MNCICAENCTEFISSIHWLRPGNGLTKTFTFETNVTKITRLLDICQRKSQNDTQIAYARGFRKMIHELNPKKTFMRFAMNARSVMHVWKSKQLAHYTGFFWVSGACWGGRGGVKGGLKPNPKHLWKGVKDPLVSKKGCVCVFVWSVEGGLIPNHLWFEGESKPNPISLQKGLNEFDPKSGCFVHMFQPPLKHRYNPFAKPSF